MSRRRMMMAQSFETYLCRDYSPNGEKFIYTIDGINLLNGDYIEISANLDTCTSLNENVISVGDASTLGSWNGNHYHSYRTRKSDGVQFIEITARYGSGVSESASRFLNIQLAGQTVVYRIDKNGISYDGIQLDPTGTNHYSDLIRYLNSVSTIAVGSQEGNTRFYGTYNYIKWVKA